MTPQQKWAAALADVIGGRKPAEVAPIVAVGEETVRRWLRGDTVPCGWMWRALVIEAKLEDHWAKLSAARDAVARPAGRPRLAKAVRVERLQKQLEEVEEMLLARLAELEAAQRWRVPAEELPPVGEWVVGHYGGSEPCEVVQYDGDQWNFRALLDVNEPDFWLPIPAVPSKPGAS